MDVRYLVTWQVTWHALFSFDIQSNTNNNFPFPSHPMQVEALFLVLSCVTLTSFVCSLTCTGNKLTFTKFCKIVHINYKNKLCVKIMFSFLPDLLSFQDKNKNKSNKFEIISNNNTSRKTRRLFAT